MTPPSPPPTLPTTATEAAARMASAPLPPELRAVAQRLHDAGHDVVVVGGAVRDWLLGRDHGDWDLASSATPEEVIALFPRTIPTGIEHGTVTILCGDRRKKPAITAEITTFRGEAGYLDGRRPTAVQFLRALVDDLARRDFTINAMAWNPLTGVFTDVFDGLGDLRAGIVRAVGEATARFQEDGLRAMRAVRLCAALAYTLEPTTAQAIAGALDTLDQVSRERVQVELTKLLRAPRPSLGLWPMVETGIWGRVLADYPTHSPTDSTTHSSADSPGDSTTDSPPGPPPGSPPAALTAAIAATDALPADPTLRLARLLWPLRGEPATAGRGGLIATILDNRLRPSRDDRARILRLCDPARATLAIASDPPTLRRAAAALGRDLLGDCLALLAVDDSQRARVHQACDGAALSPNELALGGRDLLAAGLLARGPAVGALLRELLEWVLDDPTRNHHDLLLAEARRRLAPPGSGHHSAGPAGPAGSQSPG